MSNTTNNPTAIAEKMPEIAIAGAPANANGAGQATVALPGSNQVAGGGTAPKVSFQDLLCELIICMPGGPKEFTKQEKAVAASLGFYGNGKATIGGMTFQVQVSAQVVRSNTLLPGAERTEIKRKLGLIV